MTRAQEPLSQPAAGAACRNATEPKPKLEPARGLVSTLADGIEMGRIAPSDELAGTIEHYWWVRWDVAAPRTSEVLSYPSVHVVFEGRAARIVGVVRGLFSRRTVGRGEVFALKFRPGMFRAFAGQPVWRLTDRTVPLKGELGRPAGELARAVWAKGWVLERAKLAEEWLRTRGVEPDPKAMLARDLVERVRTERELTSVAALADASGLTARALQRLFREHVGVGPKWVVRRFRLQEAAELLRAEGATVGAVAADLGYFDQAHFARDFKSVLGRAPVDYVRAAHERA